MNIKNILAKRVMRTYQERHRCMAPGPQSRFENAAICAAWASGDLSEGQVAKALGIDRLMARKMLDDVRNLGTALASEMGRS